MIAEYYNKKYETTISFFLVPGNKIAIESKDLDYEITLLPKILQDFRKIYRIDPCFYDLYDR